MKQITNEELTAIRERAEKATAKPWSVVTDELGGQAMTVIDGDNWDVIRRPYVGKDNAIFIANARQDIPKWLAEIDRLNRLYCELKEIAHNIEVNRNETAAEYREYYEKSEAEIECMKKDRKIFDNTFRNIDALIDEHRLVNNRSANGLADEIV